MQKNKFLYLHLICIICLFSHCITIKSIRHWPKEDCAVVYSSMRTKCVPPKSTGGPPIFHPVMILMAIPYTLVDTLILPVSIPFALGKGIYNIQSLSLWSMSKYKFFYPLHWAVYKRDLNQLVHLLEKGHDVNQKDGEGRTALHWAVRFSSKESMKILLSYKADPNQKDINKQTALDIAIYFQPVNYSDIIFTLVLSGADFNREEVEENKNLIFIAIQERHTPLAKFLIENKMNINIKTRYGNTPLNYAIKQENLEITELLLGKHAKLNMDDIDHDFRKYLGPEENYKEYFKEEKYILMDKLLRKYGVARIRNRWY